MKHLNSLWVATLLLILFMALSTGYSLSRERDVWVQMSLDWVHENESLYILSGTYNFVTNRFYACTSYTDPERSVYILDGNTGEDLGTGLSVEGLTLGILNIIGICVDDTGVIYGGTNTEPDYSLIRWDDETTHPIQQYIPDMGFPRVMDIKNSGTDTIIAATGKFDDDGARILETLDGKNFQIESETSDNLGKHGIALAKTGETVYLTQGYTGVSNLFTRVDKIEGQWVKNETFTPPLDKLYVPCPLGYWDEGNIVFCISTRAENGDHLYALDGDTGAIMGDLPLGVDVGAYGYGKIDLQADANEGQGAFITRRYPPEGSFCGKFHFTFAELTPTPTPTPSPTPPPTPIPGVINVPYDYPTIQAAIDAAINGDEIIVSPGTYGERINFKGKDIIVRSNNPLDPAIVGSTIIDGSRSGTVVSFSGTETAQCILSGFTITKGSSVDGGGINGNGALATIQNNQILDNKAGVSGGGINNCKGLIVNNTITKNNATYGGGLANCLDIRDNVIHANTSNTGGGLSFCKGNILNNDIFNNECINYGGAISFSEGNFQNNLIHNNIANSLGGGIAFSSGNFLNNIINNNIVRRYSLYKGYRRGYGGGLYDCSGTIKNNVIFGNSAEDQGGGLFMCYAEIENCIIWGNTAPEDSQFYHCPTVSYSCIQDWSQNGLGNISSDPLFLDSSNADFHLTGTSPCIDKGDPDISENDAQIPPGLGTNRNDLGAYGGAFNAGDYTTPAPTPTPIPTPLPTHPVINVPADYPTIQEAVEAASDGYEIVVYPGRYCDNIFFKGKNIILRSLDPNDIKIVTQTTIQFKDLDTIITFQGTESPDCTFSGFTIIATGWNPDYGGAINGNGTHATIQNNKINNNSTTRYGYGGAIYASNGLIKNNIFAVNTAGYGGALSNCNGIIDSNKFFNNRTNMGVAGGALNSCNGIIINNEIHGNYSNGNGGGLNNCSAYILNNSIGNNSCEGNGAGLASCSGIICNNTIFDNNAGSKGGGLFSCNNIVRNNTIYNNVAVSGGGLSDCMGTILNNIIWNNSSQIYNCSQPSYCCIQDWGGEVGGNISNNPLFWDPENGNFHLVDDSPCIDAGNPDLTYNDACLPPGMGTAQNDMGAFGGPNNCGTIPEPLPPPLPFLGQLKQDTDFWGATCFGVPPFGEPYLRALLGFRYDPLNNWMPLSGNANGEGLDDLIQITQYSDAWVSISLDDKNFAGTRWGWLGFRYEETIYNGWIPLNGDANGNGTDDLIQVTEYGDAWVAISMETMYNPPTRWGWLGYRFNRGVPGENGAIPLSGDANGDGRCDLIQITEYTDAWVALSAETMYNPPTRWGWLGFKYAPFDGWYPLCGDVNADGADDLIQITPTGDPWVSLSTETTYAPPTRWGWLNFYYDEAQGYYPLLGDVNADGAEDLIQITPSGEAWVAPSTGISFDYPENWGWLGFLFDRDKGYLPFYLDY